MTKKTIQLITGILLILITGVFWGTWISLSRSMHHLPPEIFITIGREIMNNVAVPMSIIMPASLMGLAMLLIWSWKEQSVYFFCLLATFILFIAALLITVTIEVPIDNQIKTWTFAAIPTDWERIRDRWEWFHTMRTWLALAGITFYMTALIGKN